VFVIVSWLFEREIERVGETECWRRMFSRAGQEKKCSTDRSSPLQYAHEGGEAKRPK